MNGVGAAAPHDIFTDNQRWGDLDDWNRTALELHSRGGIHRIGDASLARRGGGTFRPEARRNVDGGAPLNECCSVVINRLLGSSL